MNPLSFPYLDIHLEGQPFVYSENTINEIVQPEKHIRLDRCTVNGNVIGKSIKIKEAAIDGSINSLEGNIWIDRCQSLKHVEASKGWIIIRLSALDKALAEKGSIDLYQSKVNSVSAKRVSIFQSNVNKVTTESVSFLENSKIMELECTKMAPESCLIVDNCSIKVLKVSQATLSTSNSVGNAIPVKKKPIVRLFDSFVGDIVFEEGAEGKVILRGKSSVQKVVNGVTRRLLTCPKNREWHSKPEDNLALQTQSLETKDPEKE